MIAVDPATGDGERLRPSSEGRRVSLRDGQPHVDAGPFEDGVLSGYLVLEAIPAAVDVLGHRLVPVKALDLKGLGISRRFR